MQHLTAELITEPDPDDPMSAATFDLVVIRDEMTGEEVHSIRVEPGEDPETALRGMGYAGVAWVNDRT